MKITLCTNTETLRPIWGDLYDDAGITGYDDSGLANLWAKTLNDALVSRGYECEYESSFQYWHGGPGHGTTHYEGDDAEVSELISATDRLAREAAAQDIVETLAAGHDE